MSLYSLRTGTTLTVIKKLPQIHFSAYGLSKRFKNVNGRKFRSKRRHITIVDAFINLTEFSHASCVCWAPIWLRVPWGASVEIISHSCSTSSAHVRTLSVPLVNGVLTGSTQSHKFHYTKRNKARGIVWIGNIVQMGTR